MIYKKEPITNRIVEFTSEASIGAGFKNWTTLTESEILAYELEKAKKAKLAQITPARDAFMYADIEYNGSFFINSQVSGNNITGALAIMGTSINWLDTSGNLVVMTKAQLKELGALIIDRRNIGYFKEANLTNQINACTTIEEVEAINIEF